MHDQASPALADKEARLREILRGLERVLVAFSGGIDSTLLLALAREELGEAARPVLARGPSLPQRDLDDARALAARLGAELLEIETREFEDERYLANERDRCYWCRHALVEAMAPLARRENAALVYGALVDDLGEERPGMEAAENGGFRAPLLEARLTKEEVRAIARRLELPLWDKPASACLSSRVPTGVRITPERLERVDHAERGVLALGFRVVRVRDHERLARVELGADELDRLADPSLRRGIVEAVKAAGFKRVAVDLEGYRPVGLKTSERLPAG